MNNRLFLIASVIFSGICVTPAWGQYVTTSPNSQTVNVQPGAANSRQRLQGVSGGPVRASDPAVANRVDSATGPCVGYVDRQPNHALNLTARFDSLRVAVESPADTTLVVKGPGGTWCNDDFGNSQNPAIVGEWQPGRYGIWVGSYQENEYHPYILRVTQQQ